MTDRNPIPLSQDAALVAALAATAMPFSQSAEDQAERWLRTLRLHGRVGAALQALGVGEAPLMTGSEPADTGRGPAAEGVVEQVVARASELARRRRADCVGTVDLLFALFETYGRLIDRALYLRGASRDELLQRLSVDSRTEASY